MNMSCDRITCKPILRDPLEIERVNEILALYEQDQRKNVTEMPKEGEITVLLFLHRFIREDGCRSNLTLRMFWLGFALAI